MPTFIGFNTVDQTKKFTLVDFELIKRDLINALNIQQGTLPGRPQYGTTIWSYVFENQTEEIVQAIVREMQRVIAYDPRIFLADIQVYPQDNGIRLDLDIQIVPSTSAERLAVFFDINTRRASFI